MTDPLLRYMTVSTFENDIFWVGQSQLCVSFVASGHCKGLFRICSQERQTISSLPRESIDWAQNHALSAFSLP
eukprot:9397105-Karenia_brevis.AAC.2